MCSSVVVVSLDAADSISAEKSAKSANQNNVLVYKYIFAHSDH